MNNLSILIVVNRNSIIPHYRLALYYWQVTQVLEGGDEYAKRQSRLLQYGFSLGDLGEGAPKNVWRAVEAVPQFRVQPGLRRRHCFGRQDVPIVKQVHWLHTLQKFRYLTNYTQYLP